MQSGLSGPLLVGCDFSSTPTRRKPIVLALGHEQGGRVTLAGLAGSSTSNGTGLPRTVRQSNFGLQAASIRSTAHRLSKLKDLCMDGMVT